MWDGERVHTLGFCNTLSSRGKPGWSNLDFRGEIRLLAFSKRAYFLLYLRLYRIHLRQLRVCTGAASRYVGSQPWARDLGLSCKSMSMSAPRADMRRKSTNPRLLWYSSKVSRNCSYSVECSIDASRGLLGAILQLALSPKPHPTRGERHSRLKHVGFAHTVADAWMW